MPTDRRQAVLHGLVRSLVVHGQVRTTYARAREAQRLAERLVTLGKDGSVHSRRRAFVVLQDRSLVKQLFAEIAPRFVDVAGGYTRVNRLGLRLGDGAQEALLAFSRLPAVQPAVPAPPKAGPAPQAPAAPKRPLPPKKVDTPAKPKPGLFENLRKMWTRKQWTRTQQKGSGAS